MMLPGGYRISKRGSPQEYVMAGRGTRVAIRDAPRLVSRYDGKLQDWQKMTGPSYVLRSDPNERVQIHWYMNPVLNKRVEFKLK
jgi:hypothetical protein